MNVLNVSVVQGDDWTRIFTFLDNAGDSLNLDGVTFAGRLKRGDSEAAFTFDTADAGSGEIGVSLTNEATTELAGVYPYEIQMTHVDGIVETVLSGRFAITAQVETS